MSAPRISGERAMHHRVRQRTCSFWVNLVGRVNSMTPKGSMSASRALGTVSRPEVQPAEHFVKRLPPVPKIIRDAPHICVVHHMIAALDRSITGRQAEYDGSPSFINGLADGFNLDFLPIVVRACNVVHLDKIYSPGSVELE